MVTLNDNGDFEGRPHPVRYELIDKDGKVVGESPSAQGLAIAAKDMWPDQQQDPERSGVGWDIQALR